MRKFIIISTGRTGTLSLAKTLDTIPRVSCTHEEFHEARMISNLRWDNQMSESEAKLRVKLGYDIFSKPIIEGTADIVIDSNCLMWNFADLTNMIDPNVCFIYIVRNAKDTIQSMVNTGYYGATKYPWEKRARKGYYNITDEDYDEEKHRLNCTFGYILRNNMIDTSLRHIESTNPDRVLRLNFEDMLEDNQSYLDRITGYIEDRSGLKLDLSKTKVQHHHKSKTKK